MTKELTLKRAEAYAFGMAITTLSDANKETGFPVYDLGFEVNYALGATLRKNKSFFEEIEKARQKLAEEIQAIRASKNGDANLEIESKRKEWEEYMLSDVKLQVHQVSPGKVQSRGTTPTPVLLEALEPLWTTN